MGPSVTLDQARDRFEQGLYRHYKGPLYLAIALADDHEKPTTDVFYRSLTNGKLYHRPLAEAPSSWYDHVQWPPPEGKDHWPWGSMAPRFVQVPVEAYATVFLISGPPHQGASVAARVGSQIPEVECVLVEGGLSGTVAHLRHSLPDKVVVPLWVSGGQKGPPGCLSLSNGYEEYIRGQLEGIARAVDRTGPTIETHGRPITG